MQEKTTRLRKLLNDGFEVVDVQSDATAVEATLRKDGAVVRLRFFRSEAADLFAIQSVQ